MNGETYKGIPRRKIPWYPIINYEKCVCFGKCVDYCKLGAYEFEEVKGNERVVVKNPYNCVVLCTGCETQYLSGALSHPSKQETRKIIVKLKKAMSA